MLKTIFILIATIVIVPIVAFQFDQPLSAIQITMLRNSALIMLGIALLCFVVSELTGNCSQVDKLWSITPIIYTWYFAMESEWSPRLILMAALATVWGVRLTYNFGRRGAYRLKFWEGHEDYRWEVLRQKPFLQSRWKWTLFNLGFISLYQNTLIWLFTLPAVLAFQAENQQITWADGLLAAIFIGLVVIETIADQQQWNYQTEKHRRMQSGEPLGEYYGKGFVHTGLWKWVRHPNYAAEQSIWITFFLFSVVATGRYMNWSVTGVLLLLLLFQGSADFSEEISSGKYPGYRDYVRDTPRFLPKFW
ncbi:MAG: DUF1295 domain-containing protein [Chitinophagales bacterium]